MITSEIKVISFFPPTLDSRVSATKLAKIIKDELVKNTKVDLDFQDIIFMSRSFADQLHKDIMACDNSLDINIKNADLGIIEMLNTVSKTQYIRKPIKKSYKVLSFNNLELLRDYSYAW